MQRIRILIVDNDPKIVDLLKAVFDSFGFAKITTAKDGQLGLAMMRTRKFDLVLSDWQMPGMDGLEFIRRVRTDPNSPDCFVPIIMITGRAERGDIEKARDMGVTEFLAKPFTIEDLRLRIISVFDHPREFVFAGRYTGPSRRRKNLPFDGKDRRSKE